jgi:hypothetical protein
MEEEFRAILTAATAVTNIAPSSRINFGEHPQGAAFPAIVLNTIGDNAGQTLKGSDELSIGRVQVDCYAMTYGAAKLLSRAALAALDTYRGGDFLAIFHVGTRDTREGGSNEAERPYRVSLDFITNWSD